MQRPRTWAISIIGTGLLLVLALISVSPAVGQHSLLIDDFESDDFAARWWWYTEDTPFSCSLDSPGRDSDHALRLQYENGPDQWPGCGTDVTDPASWQQAEGLRFVWRGDAPGQDFELVLNVADPTQTNPDAEGYTPFEAYLTTPGTGWEEITLAWDAFAKADWVGPGGINTLDLTHIEELLLITGENSTGTVWIDDIQLVSRDVSSTPPADAAQPAAANAKYAVWTNGTQLRGINIWQRIVVPHVDGDEFLGSDHVGPPYGIADFDQIARLGANYVVLSTSGLYTETPPYQLDAAVQANLDQMLALAAEADLFVVIAVRTGPGRSDFSFYDEDIEEWGDPSLVYDNVWTDQAAQDAWVEMWRYTAERYRDNPVVVGYELMVEPNAAGRLLDIYEPDEFYPAHENTLYDWNQLYPRLVAGIRSADATTPILVGPMGWSAVRWLPYLRVIDDPYMVYTVHQYEPQEQYTHQEPGGTNTYPGQFDIDYDDVPDTFDRAWLAGYLSIISDFQAAHGVPVTVTEYGVERWVPNASDFMRDEMQLFDELGLNHAFWAWNSIWPPHNIDNDAFDIMHGPDPDHHQTVDPNALLDTVRANWSQNNLRPSTLRP